MSTRSRSTARARDDTHFARRPLALLVFLLTVLRGVPAGAFGFDDVAALAQSAAEHAYRAESDPPPGELQALTYDQ